jgi:restriction system protein
VPRQAAASLSRPADSAQTRDYADRVNARLVLIDGPELAALMIEHDCGVMTEEFYTLKQVDENFFEET